MIQLIFKNLRKSKITEEVVKYRIGQLVEKFPDLKQHRIQAILTAENKKQQPGPDLFGVRLIIHGRKFKNLIMEKKAGHLYSALGFLCDSALEILNRYLDRVRIVKIKQKRKLKQKLNLMGFENDLKIESN